VLEQTKEIVQYSKALEKKSAELERTTQQLKEANERLQELDRLKADFITTVTHELRTPITSIRALSKIMLDSEELQPEQQQEFLQIVVSESERLTRLINQVLDIEKIQSEEGELALSPVDFNEIVERSVNGLQQLMKERGVKHRLALREEALEIMGHFDRLTQVVVNLLSNAIKFCDDEGGRVEIRVHRKGHLAILEIEDNGPGLSPKQQELIFEKFTQISDKLKGKPQGSGLGLFISYTIVEQHGGRIGVESRLGEGATFWVELPLQGVQRL